MLVKSSSTNYSLSPNNLYLDMYCFITRPSSILVSAYFIINIVLILPLCIFIVYHGLRRWKRGRSTSSAPRMSHSDCLTYHMVTMELTGVFGCVFNCYGIYENQFEIFLVGFYLFSFTWFGQTCFHLLTCLEHYLAVAHPVTYMGLRNEKGIRIRNIFIGVSWLLCVVFTGLIWKEGIFIVMNFSMLILSLIIISFFCVSVLYVLIRPGPGEQGGGRERVDQSKQRAFYTIVTILGVLVLRFSWALVWTIVFATEESLNCLLMVSDFWFYIPSSLVLPLLFLQRAGKFRKA